MSHSNNSSDAPICNTTESSAMNTVNNMKDPAQTELPTVMTFKDLHEPENLELAKTSLKGKSGIYCIRHIATGKIYIGQAQDIFVRIIQHINGSTNTHLKHALSLYSLEAFEFLVVEFVTDTSLLTTREQVYLDWLFSLSEDFRYNFCSTANSTLGYTHTAETKAIISERKSGENHPMFGKTHTAETKALISECKSGENHPMFGKTHTTESIDLIRLNQPNLCLFFVYDLENKLVGQFPSQKSAAKFLNVSRGTVQNYLASGKVLNGKYILRSSSLS